MKVILAAPDIDIDVFRSQLEVIGPLSPPMTLLVSRDDKALDLSRRIADARQRVGTIDVDDPRVQDGALRAKVQIVDISNLSATDPFNHDRYVSLSTIYRRLADTASRDPGGDLTRAGAFVFNTVGRTLSAPLAAAGVGQSGQ
jgi:esterase/lipase superfamily enzyme